MKRKEAVRQLSRYIHHSEGYLARLSLHYVAEHDPSFTVRNIARQAFYRIGEPPDGGSWERAFFF